MSRRGRIEHSDVTTELAFQRAQGAKREATDALRDGNVDYAIESYHAASMMLRNSDLSGADPGAAQRMAPKQNSSTISLFKRDARR